MARMLPPRTLAGQPCAGQRPDMAVVQRLTRLSLPLREPT